MNERKRRQEERPNAFDIPGRTHNVGKCVTNMENSKRF
jgi:hypothetical protein